MVFIDEKTPPSPRQMLYYKFEPGHIHLQILGMMSFLYLANAGSGVGGARPKALLHEDDNAYLAKFNRISVDTYNNAKVELAGLQMAKAAGLNVLGGHVRKSVNGRDVLLLDRFDVVMENNLPKSRRHLITINALLKDAETQRDKAGIFLYDDIYNLVKRFSIDIEADLTQLLRNWALKNDVSQKDSDNVKRMIRL